MKQFQNLITPLLVIALFLSSFSFSPREQQQVSTSMCILHGNFKLIYSNNEICLHHVWNY